MSRRWTKLENEEFISVWLEGRRTPKSLANQYNRSEKQIREHAYRLGLPSYSECKMFITKKYITDSFEYDSKCCNTVFKSCPFKERKNGRANISHIASKDFWKWAYENKERIDFSKYRKGSLSDEPKWLQDEMKVEKRWKVNLWSKEEDKMLALLYESGKSISEIAEKMNRSYSGVAHRASKLNTKRNIQLKKINIKWTEEEYNMLIKLRSEGKTYRECAYELGREPSHIADKLKRMRCKND